MRITIESTVSEARYAIKAIVEVPYDDVEVPELYDMLRQAVLGAGYHPESVRDIFNEDDPPK